MSRSLSADLIKTLSIFPVAYVHPNGIIGCNDKTSQVISWAIRYCVPCFILLWAYFFEKSYAKKDKQEQKVYLKKRFIHCLQVFLLWSIIYFLLVPEFWKMSPVKIITMYFTGYGWSGQYFFIILLQLLLLLPLLRLIYNNAFLRYATVVGVIAIYFLWGYAFSSIPGVIQKLGDRPFIFWVVYVFAGIALARNELPKIPVLFTVAVFLIPVEFFMLEQAGMEHSPYVTPAVLIGSLLFCIALLQSNITLKSQTATKFIEYVGRNTMTVFILNPLVIIGIGRILPQEYIPCGSELTAVLFHFFIAIVIMAVCFLAAEIIRKVKLDGVVN